MNRPTPASTAVRLLVATALSAAPTVAWAQTKARPPRGDQTPVFRTRVGMTRVKAAVMDDAGNPVSGLTIADFRVLEDGVERDVQLVLDPVRISMDVALVLDFSRSIARDWSSSAARQAAISFIGSLAPDDCVYLLPFHERVGPGIWAKADAKELQWAIEEQAFGSYTRLYDAVMAGHTALDRRRPDSASAAAEEMDDMLGTWMEPVRDSACGEPLSPDEAIDRRSALVVLTDGDDTGSTGSYSDVLMASWRSEVPVFAVAVGLAAEPPRRRASRWGSARIRQFREQWENIRTLQDQLRELARVSGGQLILQRDLRDGYADTLGMLRAYYVLAYPTPDDPGEGWHELEIEVLGDGNHVVAQPGIYRTRENHVAAVSSLREASVQYEVGDYEGALERFEFATSVSPDVGAPFFGRGLVLEKLARWEEARSSYERSLQMRPGAAATHSRLAEVLVQLDEYQAAWDHATSAHRGGVDMGSMFARLATVSPPPEGQAERMVGPVVHLLKPPVPGLEEQIVLRDLTRNMMAAFDADPMLGITPSPVAADFTVRIWVRKVSAGSPRKLTARLVVVDRHDRRTQEQSFEVANLEDLVVVKAAVNKAVAAAGEWILERHNKR